MRHQPIILKLPTELLARLDAAAFAARRTRDELLHEICRDALAPGNASRPRWISLHEAARRSGHNVGHVRKLCPGYAVNGVARKLRRDNKGKASWEVREDANPAFAPAPAPAETEGGT